MMLKLETAKWRQKHLMLFFFQCSLNFWAHALQSEFNKVSISNFVKFRLQSMSSKIERAFEKTTKLSIKIMLKRALIRQLKRTINQCKIFFKMKKYTFFVRIYCYTLKITSLWYWKSLLANLLVFWKLCP